MHSPFVLKRLLFNFTFAYKNALLSTKLPLQNYIPKGRSMQHKAHALTKKFLPFHLFGCGSNILRLSLGDRLLCFDKNREILSAQVCVQLRKRQVSKASTLKPAQLKTNEKNMQPADSDSWWTLAKSTGQLTQKKLLVVCLRVCTATSIQQKWYYQVVLSKGRQLPKKKLNFFRNYLLQQTFLSILNTCAVFAQKF